MKKNAIILVLLLFIGFGTVSFNLADKAPIARIGYVSPNKLLMQISGIHEDRARLDTLNQEFQVEMQRKMQAYQEKAQALESEKAILNELVLKDRTEELSAMQTAIREFQDKAKEAMQQKEQELMQPYANRLSEAIEAVAKEKGFTHVLNANATPSAMFMYAEGYTDLDSLVSVRLNPTNHQ